MVALPAAAAAASPPEAAKSDATVASWGEIGAPSAEGSADRMASFKDDIVLDKDGGATFTETID